MLYSIIRFIIVILLFFVLFFIIYKIKPKTIKLFILLDFILVSLIGIFLYWYPIENMFINFSSPQDVFTYTNTGEINDIIYGDNSCMIVYSDNSGLQTSFFKIDNDSYKIITFAQYNSQKFLSKDNTSAEFITLKGINDCYCFGSIYTTNNIKITDNLSSDYFTFQIDDNLYNFYGYISNYNEDYTLFVNDKKVNFIKN
ncbi:MAG: hypothetical protein J1E85_10165 [Ruminococcus sp.]|nr:hypothetical protein [Ruminococcus sp.]